MAMCGLEYREVRPEELGRIREIDRSERVNLSYQVVGEELRPVAVDWQVPTFRPEGDGEHTVTGVVRFCERHLAAGARAVGAFAGGQLVGIGLMTPEIRPGLAQLAFLHVSRLYRGSGVGTRLFEDLISFALESGARQVYVSAVPSESAVGFYRSRGFRVATPLPELYELEPDDIHMTLDLSIRR